MKALVCHGPSQNSWDTDVGHSIVDAQGFRGGLRSRTLRLLLSAWDAPGLPVRGGFDGMSGFKTFLLRGNLIDIAVGIVIGVAFGTVIAALVKDLITPLIAAIGGKQDFSALSFTVNNSKFAYGDFINALLAFVIIVAVLYFFVISPYATFKARFEKAPAAELETKDCTRCLSKIPVGSTRCAFCSIDIQ